MSGNFICVIEDEPSIAQSLQYTLEKENFVVSLFTTGFSFLNEVDNLKPDLVVLDVGLPDSNGFDIFRQLRQQNNVPVIFLTARADEIDRVVGLEMGADDYVVKPFSPRELVARVRAVIRRTQDSEPESVTNLEIFTINKERMEIAYCGTPLQLTLHEYKIMELLLKHPQRIFSRTQLLDYGWDAPEHRLERTVDSHIKSIRSKLKQIAPDAEAIRTHRGVGYSLSIK